jgi:hypothetical protein
MKKSKSYPVHKSVVSKPATSLKHFSVELNKSSKHPKATTLHIPNKLSYPLMTQTGI